jgi:hypothetical protein
MRGQLDKRDAGAGTVIIGGGSDAPFATVDGGIDLPGERISESEWQAMIAPRTGDHAVDDRGAGGCQPVALGPEYVVQPTITCTLDPAYANVVYQCSVAPYCTSHEQCRERPYGLCLGTAYSMCSYPGTATRVSCASDGDCSALPGGACTREDSINCYPTGRCDPAGAQFCTYPDQSCRTDAECRAAPGGHCSKSIFLTSCEYLPCLADADCGANARCLCVPGISVRCVPADCYSDGDCPAGHECRLQSTCFDNAYHCATDTDSCRSNADCGPPLACMFMNAHWQCADPHCPDVP